MIALNVTALVELTQLFLPGMIARGRGRILNIGSTAGFQPGPFMATYYATKAYVNSFTEALSHELRGTGVTATVSCPGPTATEFTAVAGTGHSPLTTMGEARADTVALEAYRAMLAGKPMVIHGFKNKLANQSLRVSPRAAIRWLVAGLNRSKLKALK
jgi:short-subunit dehydrogenase